MTTKSKKNVINPVDAEITEIIMDAKTSNQEKKEQSKFTKAVEETKVESNPVTTIETEVKTDFPTEKFTSSELVLPKRFLVCEILYLINNDVSNVVPNRKKHKYDFTEILLDFDTVLCIERVYRDRLFDFGMSIESANEIEEEDSCILHCSAFTDPILLTEYSFEEMVNLHIDYRNEKR